MASVCGRAAAAGGTRALVCHRCSWAHSCSSLQHDGGCMAFSLEQVSPPAWSHMSSSSHSDSVPRAYPCSLPDRQAHTPVTAKPRVRPSPPLNVPPALPWPCLQPLMAPRLPLPPPPQPPSPPAAPLTGPPTTRPTPPRCPTPTALLPTQPASPSLLTGSSLPVTVPADAGAAAATAVATTAVNAAATPGAAAGTATATTDPSMPGGPSDPPVPSAPAQPRAARGHAAAQQLRLRSRRSPERGDLLALLPGRPNVPDICVTHPLVASAVMAAARDTGVTARGKESLKREKYSRTGTGACRFVPPSQETFGRAGPAASALLNEIAEFCGKIWEEPV